MVDIFGCWWLENAFGVFQEKHFNFMPAGMRVAFGMIVD
jgi:hypothetical protein